MKKMLLILTLTTIINFSATAQNYEEQPSPGFWKNQVFPWYYNDQNVPTWLEKNKSLEFFINAAERWKICGIDLKFMGKTNSIPGKMDRINVVGWSDKIPQKIRGITVGKSEEDHLIERDILIQSSRLEFQASQRLLEKVITHEFGHAIGLTHSKRCDDVMTLAADCPKIDPELLPINPTDNDLFRCRKLYN